MPSIIVNQKTLQSRIGGILWDTLNKAFASPFSFLGFASGAFAFGRFVSAAMWADASLQ